MSAVMGMGEGRHGQTGAVLPHYSSSNEEPQTWKYRLLYNRNAFDLTLWFNLRVYDSLVVVCLQYCMGVAFNLFLCCPLRSSLPSFRGA